MPAAIKWTPELEDSICACIAINTKGLDDICDENDEFPSPRSIYTRLIQCDSFLQKYTRARDLQQQLLADQILPIADKDRICEKRTIKPDGSEERVILDQVERSKLQIETRKWLLSKLNPKKYGDKQLHTGADGEGPIEVSIADRLNRARKDETQP
jgi:hypothetical protein